MVHKSNNKINSEALMSSSLLNSINSSIPEVSADLRISDFLKVNPIKLASFDVNICKVKKINNIFQLKTVLRRTIFYHCERNC